MAIDKEDKLFQSIQEHMGDSLMEVIDDLFVWQLYELQEHNRDNPKIVSACNTLLTCMGEPDRG